MDIEVGNILRLLSGSFCRTPSSRTTGVVSQGSGLYLFADTHSAHQKPVFTGPCWLRDYQGSKPFVAVEVLDAIQVR